jgi:glycosyltransferase involved in cell wall biosynthesis
MIALDLSRLLSRAHSATPSGIDRVELAYARHILAGERPHCFVGLNTMGRIGALPPIEASQFVNALAAAGRDGATARDRRRIAAMARRLRYTALLGGERRLLEAVKTGGDPVYLLVSHHHLDLERSIARLKKITGARFVCFIHDVIPLDFPSFTRPSQTRRHRRRIATAAAFAGAVIVNSAATRAALLHRLGGSSTAPVAIAPLGLDFADVPAAAPDERPYFVCIGTIEARKNHGALLDVWRRLLAELGGHAPRLLVIGQRGWGSQTVIKRLAGMRPAVIEHRDLPDTQVVRLLRGAVALLLPSLAEGFGLPVIEALALGVPVICSDLPALRESGGGVPDYLDPADTDAWHAVLGYLTGSPRRQAQLARLAAWRPPRWEDHFAIVDRVIGALI